jgi:predicted DCC family thiol-disulfide oxidoreductase YuxK
VTDAPVLLYDGVCILCSRGVRFVLRHEREQAIRFVAIQSDAGRALVLAHGVSPEAPDTFLFIDAGNTHRKSDAVLALAGHLKPPYSWFGTLRVLPGGVRNWFYDRIAMNRYRLFGRRETCAMPDPASRHRFTLPAQP